MYASVSACAWVCTPCTLPRIDILRVSSCAYSSIQCVCVFVYRECWKPAMIQLIIFGSYGSSHLIAKECALVVSLLHIRVHNAVKRIILSFVCVVAESVYTERYRTVFSKTLFNWYLYEDIVELCVFICFDALRGVHTTTTCDFKAHKTQRGTNPSFIIIVDGKGASSRV